MSINSSYQLENSAALAKRYAALAAGYVDDPEAAKSDLARVPLSNLFRILEMFRYNAFLDESRRGVLVMERIGRRRVPAVSKNWQAPIVAALEQALRAAFDVPKTQAIDQLEDGLRDLVNGRLSAAQAKKVKKFFSTLETSLA